MTVRSFPRTLTYLARQRVDGALIFVGSVEGDSLQDAAKNAATMLFDRADVRPCLVGSVAKGEFIAHGRVSWIRYKRGEVVREIRFQLERKHP